MLFTFLSSTFGACHYSRGFYAVLTLVGITLYFLNVHLLTDQMQAERARAFELRMNKLNPLKLERQLSLLCTQIEPEWEIPACLPPDVRFKVADIAAAASMHFTPCTNYIPRLLQPIISAPCMKANTPDQRLLGVVKQVLDTLLRDLNDLRRLHGELPAAQTTEHFRRTFNGASHTYNPVYASFRKALRTLHHTTSPPLSQCSSDIRKVLESTACDGSWKVWGRDAPICCRFKLHSMSLSVSSLLTTRGIPHWLDGASNAALQLAGELPGWASDVTLGVKLVDNSPSLLNTVLSALKQSEFEFSPQVYKSTKASPPTHALNEGSSFHGIQVVKLSPFGNPDAMTITLIVYSDSSAPSDNENFGPITKVVWGSRGEFPSLSKGRELAELQYGSKFIYAFENKVPFYDMEPGISPTSLLESGWAPRDFENDHRHAVLRVPFRPHILREMFDLTELVCPNAPFRGPEIDAKVKKATEMRTYTDGIECLRLSQSKEDSSPCEVVDHSSTTGVASSRGGTCALVGSSGIMREANYAEAINQHDLVFRFNSAVVDGYEWMVGRPADIAISNKRLRMREYISGRPMNHHDASVYYVMNSRDWVHPKDPNDAAIDMCEVLQVNQHTYKGAMCQLTASASFPTIYPTEPCFDGEVPTSYYKASRRNPLPTVGILTTLFASSMCDHVSVYGFSHSAFYHYWDDTETFHPVHSTLWERSFSRSSASSLVTTIH